MAQRLAAPGAARRQQRAVQRLARPGQRRPVQRRPHANQQPDRLGRHQHQQRRRVRPGQPGRLADQRRCQRPHQALQQLVGWLPVWLRRQRLQPEPARAQRKPLGQPAQRRGGGAGPVAVDPHHHGHEHLWCAVGHGGAGQQQRVVRHGRPDVCQRHARQLRRAQRRQQPQRAVVRHAADQQPECLAARREPDAQQPMERLRPHRPELPPAQCRRCHRHGQHQPAGTAGLA